MNIAKHHPGSAGRLLALLLAASAAQAAPATKPVADPLFKPLIDMRLRYENVDQTGFANEANALTMRVRAGGDLRVAPATRILVEAEAVLGLVNDYNSTTNGKLLYPVVADPENIEINRLQISNKSIANTTLTAGRQRINLDDQRFVGAVAFRQSEQTFDAARIETSPVKNLKIDLTYAWKDNTIFGVDSPIAHINGNNVFANVAYATPVGTLTGFGYWVDQDAPTRLQFSSVTYGARFAGKYAFSKTANATYALSYAHQQQAFDNPFTYDADYYLADVGLGFGGFAIGGGYEVLGSSSGKAFTAFQTPLATLHKFQGWADKFLTTPGNGVRDAYASAGYTVTKVGPFASVSALAVYHDFKSDRGGFDYGSEIDLQLLAKFEKYVLTLKYADYNADSFATDTSKLWVSVDYAF